MTSLDTLSMNGPELTTEQLDTVDGGLLFTTVVIIGLLVLNGGIWGAVAVS